MDAEMQAELAEQLQEQINSLAEVELALSAGHEDEELLLLKTQLEEGISQLHDSLLELQQHAQQQQQQQEQQQLGFPDWMQPNAPCRFRYTDGRHYCGRIHSLQQEQQQQQQGVTVSFAFPTSAYMLHHVQLPAGLVLPAAGQQQQQQQFCDSSSSSSGGLSVGSRVLALAPGEELWQPAEVLELALVPPSSEAAAAAAGDSSSSTASGTCRVVLVSSGQAVTLPLSAVTLSALAAVEHEEQDAAATAAAAAAAAVNAASDDSDGSSSDASMSGSEGSDDDAVEDDKADEEMAAGLGLGGGVLHHAQLAAAAGVAQDSASFAAWESHSRGIASRLLARMGFRRGSGLGKSGTGITAPLEISMLPTKKGLGAAPKHKHKHSHGHSSGKQRSKGRNRGGERTRRRKAAAARHAAKEADGRRQGNMEAATGSEGVFAFINFNLGTGSEAAGKLRDAGVGHTPQQQQQTAGAAALASAAAAAGAAGGSRHKQQQQHRAKQQQPDRKNLVGSHDDVAAAKARVSHLAAMLKRNESNRALAPQIRAKLAAAQREYDAAAAQHRQMRQAVTASEAASKWAKF